ncbi:MAG: DUF3850 domain-containing protein [Caulobacteraceae bacterium]
MAIHELKTWTDPFALVRRGAKPFELRWNDRDYQVGDTLVLQEFHPVQHRYTGEQEVREITCLITDEMFGVKPGYVAIGMREVPRAVDLSAAMTGEQLAAWHEAHGRNARLKAGTWTENAAGLPEGSASRARSEAAARNAGAEAEMHEGAAAVIRGLLAVASPELRF